MSLKKFAHILFSGIIFVGVLAGCNEPECTTATDPLLRIRFVIQYPRRASTGVIQQITKDTSIWLVRVTGIGNTSGNYVSQVRDSSSVSILNAYLPQKIDSATFVIEWDTAGVFANRGPNSIFKDTIQVQYQRQTYFVSEGCGFNYRFRNISLRRETFTKSKSGQIRSVTVTNPLADEALLPNITILFVNRRIR